MSCPEWTCPEWCDVDTEHHEAVLPDVGAYVHTADVTVWGTRSHLSVGRVTRPDGRDDPLSPVVLLANIAEDEITPAQARSLATSLLIAADMAEDVHRPAPQLINWQYRTSDYEEAR